MSTTATQVEHRLGYPTLDDELIHVFCCTDEDSSLCGIDLSGTPVVDDDDDECVVCVELERTGFCPVNGGLCVKASAA